MRADNDLLSVYALARVRDLRYIAEQQAEHGYNVQGQMDFDSGWEWGYWIQGVVTARASWDPCTTCANDTEALNVRLMDITRIFGPAEAQMRALLVQLAEAEEQLLVFGQLNNGTFPSSVIERSGAAYTEGWDTWAALGSLGAEDNTGVQPKRLGPDAVRDPKINPSYWSEIRPLLVDMNETFSGIAAQFAALGPLIPASPNVTALYDEIVDSATMLALRSSSMLGMYDFSASWYKLEYSKEWRQERIDSARASIEQAAVIVTRREAQYRVPLERIGSWRDGPTSYVFTYLWEVHSLFFWWRDYAIATMESPETLSPCFRNIIQPIDVIIGEGILDNATYLLWEYLESQHANLDFIADCLDPPKDEPQYDN